MPAVVLAEVDYFLRDDRAAMASLVEDVLDPRSRYQFEPTSPADVLRAMVFDAKFDNLGLGLVDGVVAAVAERLGIWRRADDRSGRLRAAAGRAALLSRAGARAVSARPSGIDTLIVNRPYQEPQRHWRYERESRTFSLPQGRRPAGYVVATPGSKSFDDPGQFEELALPNQIRPRVAAWRAAGYHRPDFLVRLQGGTTLVLEVKGQDSPQNQAKRCALTEWVEAVNGHGGFGRWASAVSRQPSDVTDLLAAAGSGRPAPGR